MRDDSYKEINKKTYDGVAEDYINRDKKVVDETREVGIALGRFIKLLPPGGNVLDIGSGGGRDSRFLFNYGFKMIGIDFSKKLIAMAREVEPRIDYRVMDLEELDFPNQAFDGIWANASLHHIPKSHLGAVLKKIFQMLKNNGILFIKVKQGVADGLREDIKFGKLITRYFAFYKLDELENLLRDLGFTIINSELTTKEEWVDILAKKVA